LEVLDRLNELPLRRRRAVFDHLRKIQNYPGHYSAYTVQEPDGTRLDASILGNLHLFYWTDMADRHIKILRIAENE
jgi:hypothetical protein